jgi:lipoate-protein ligase A
LQALRILVNGPQRGEKNMAIDSWLLENAAADPVPVLRFYQWIRPTLSLGYFQKIEQVSPLAWPDPEIDLCRRPTGGGGILHHLELTFSLTLPAGHAWLACPVQDSYLAICRPVVDLLNSLGVAAAYRGEKSCGNLKAANCFAGRACPDIVVQGKKIFGAAQRRRPGAVMTHGSLALRYDKKIWQRVFGERLGDGFTSLADWIQPPEPDFLARQLAASWGRALKLQAGPWDLPAAAAQAIARLEKGFVAPTKAEN